MKVTLGAKVYELNPGQARFLKSDKKYVANVGGRGSGKTFGLVLKIIMLMLKYPNNNILLGREDYSDLRDSSEKDFFDICPQEYIKRHDKQARRLIFHNGSTLMFRGLKDVSKTSIRSLNLGTFALEQAEEIEETLFNELCGCLRRPLIDSDGRPGVQQGLIICNPALNWVWRKFKQETNDNHELIQSSTLDNEKNLDKGFIDDLMSKPESWKRAMVFGQFDEGLLAERAVFSAEDIEKLYKLSQTPISNTEGIDMFAGERLGDFQLGVDPSEGAEDPSVIKGISCRTGREVMSYVGRIAPDLLAYKVDRIGRLLNNARVVLEINGIGLATLTKLKELAYPNIYVREEFDHHSKTITKKLGWRTTSANKPLLIGNFQELVRKGFVKISDQKTLEEMRSFVYTDEVKRRGMGAETGFHDDRVIGTALAYWELNKPTTGFITETVEPKDKPLYYLKDVLALEKDDKWLDF